MWYYSADTAGLGRGTPVFYTFTCTADDDRILTRYLRVRTSITYDQLESPYMIKLERAKYLDLLSKYFYLLPTIRTVRYMRCDATRCDAIQCNIYGHCATTTVMIGDRMVVGYLL